MRDISSIIPHCVQVEANFSLGRDVIGCRQSKTRGETLWQHVIERLCAQPNNGILAGADPELDTTGTENDSEMKKEVEQTTLHRMADVHDLWGMWQGSHKLCATQKESRALNKQMTAMGYISDMEGIVKALWSVFQHDGAVAFQSSEWSPSTWPLSAKNLAGGWTQIINVRWIWRINCYPAESDKDSPPECISDAEVWLNWSGDSEYPINSDDDWAADIESDTERENNIEDPECPQKRELGPGWNVSRLIRPTRQSKRQAEMVLMMVNAIETWRNKGVKKK